MTSRATGEKASPATNATTMAVVKLAVWQRINRSPVVVEVVWSRRCRLTIGGESRRRTTSRSSDAGARFGSITDAGGKCSDDAAWIARGKGSLRHIAGDDAPRSDDSAGS